MYSLVQYRNMMNLALSKFVADNDEDIKDLPTDIEVGSEVFVIESSSKYMLNHQGKWIKLKFNSSGNNIIDEDINMTLLGTTVEE